MARPRKVTTEAICQRYQEAIRLNQRFPVSVTAKAFGISTRTVNRRLIEAVHSGVINPDCVALPIFRPQAKPKVQELIVSWT